MEFLPAKMVGKRYGIGRGLALVVLTLQIHRTAITAKIRQTVRECLHVQIRQHRQPARTVCEPVVVEKDTLLPIAVNFMSEHHPIFPPLNCSTVRTIRSGIYCGSQDLV